MTKNNSWEEIVKDNFRNKPIAGDLDRNKAIFYNNKALKGLAKDIQAHHNKLMREVLERLKEFDIDKEGCGEYADCLSGMEKRIDEAITKMKGESNENNRRSI